MNVPAPILVRPPLPLMTPVMLVEEATTLTDAENDRLWALVQDLKIAPTFDEKDS